MMGGLLYERDLSSHTLTCPSFVFDVNWLNVNIIPQCASMTAWQPSNLDVRPLGYIVGYAAETQEYRWR